MTITLFSVAILLTLAAAIYIEIRRGLAAGWMKTLIRLINTLSSIIIAAILSPILTRWVVEEMNWTPILRSLRRELRGMETLLKAVVAVVASTVVFVLLFFLIRGLVSLILRGVYKTYLTKDPEHPDFARKKTWADRNERPLCCVLGSLCGVLAVMALTSPLMGSFEVATRAIDMAEMARGERVWMLIPESEEEIRSVKRYAHDLPGNVLYQMGGKYMYRAAASTKVGDERIFLFHELEVLEEASVDFMRVVPILAKPELATEAELNSLDRLCDHLERLTISDILLAEALPMGANAWLEGKSFATIPKPVMCEELAEPFDELLRVCARSTEVNACRNTVTLLQIYRLMLSAGVPNLQIESEEELLDFLSKTMLLERLGEILNENPAMYPVRHSMEALVMRSLSEQLQGHYESVIQYHILMGELAEAVSQVRARGYGTEEERVNVLTSYARQSMNEYGVEVSDRHLELLSSELLSFSYGKGAKFTRDHVDEFFGSFLKEASDQ